MLPGASDRLGAQPSEQLGLLFEPEEFACEVKRRLFMPVYETDHVRPCCEDVCGRQKRARRLVRRGRDRVHRHNGAKNVLGTISTSAGVNPTLEQPGLLPPRPDDAHANGRQPADVYYPSWLQGAPAAFDFAVSSPHRQSARVLAFQEVGRAAQEYESVKRNHATTRVLLRSRAPVSTVDQDGRTCLHHWAERGDAALQVLGDLLEARADVTARDYEGLTPLALAARGGRLPAVRLLCEGGALSDITGEGGHAEAAALVARAAGSSSSEAQAVEVVKFLLESRCCPAGGAAATTSGVGLKAMRAMSPLVAAATLGRLQMARLLLGARADAGAADAAGRRPLPSAAAAGSLELCGLLLEARAEVNARGTAGATTPGGDAPGAAAGVTALSIAAAGGGISLCRALLEARADPELADERGATPLMAAAREGFRELCGELLAARAMPSTRPEGSGKTALLLAAGAGHAAVCATLLEARADVDEQGSTGAGPLHAAAANGHEGVCWALLAAGADVSAPGPGGRSAPALAAAAGLGALAASLSARAAPQERCESEGDREKRGPREALSAPARLVGMRAARGRRRAKCCRLGVALLLPAALIALAASRAAAGGGLGRAAGACWAGPAGSRSAARRKSDPPRRVPRPPRGHPWPIHDAGHAIGGADAVRRAGAFSRLWRRGGGTPRGPPAARCARAARAAVPAGHAWFVKTETFSRPFPEVIGVEAHRAWVAALREEGAVVTSGYRVDSEGKPGGGGMLFFAARDYEAAEVLVRKDPLIANDCRARWTSCWSDLRAGAGALAATAPGSRRAGGGP
ncbi:unnamed protein product [Prorocentrum cordatum]|uniref:YCII-related domain-containing protein n=1 Tax=Prorocentrum cordatum TaxID=2364126 RepID=A0ABN9RGH9_9DINO|nr:unnamed protein product [Polarella glacialis]